MKTNERI